MKALLQRQIQKHLAGRSLDDPQLQAFLAAIKGTYDELVAGNDFLSHTLEITSQELTELNERSRSAVEAELRLKSAALDAASNGVIITDRTGQIVWSNPAFSAISGYSFAELVGQNIRLLKSGKHSSEFYKNLWSTILEGKVWQNEVTTRRKDGVLIEEEMTITPLLNHTGEITHFIAIRQDISDRRRLEEQYRQSQKMEAIGLLAGGVAHDFNNSLQVILGYCETLLEQLPPPNVLREEAEEIQKAANRSAKLTKQLLAFSRRQLLSPIVVDLNAVLRDTSKMLQALLGEDIRLALHPAPDLWPVRADTGNMEQIIMNLAVNARDAMPKGGQITFTTANADLTTEASSGIPEARAGSFVCLTVADNGCGMSAEVRSRIFEPFFSTKGNLGTGLGLSVIHGIIHQHNGWINVASEIGVGTSFKVYLPAVMPAAVAPDNDTALLPKIPAAHGERILMLEDEPALRRLSEKFLQRVGYQVFAAATVAEAEAIFAREQGRFALFFTDVVLPDGSGFDVAEKFRVQNPALAVLITSGYTDERNRWGDSQKRHFSFLQKPYGVHRMFACIQQMIGQRIS